MRQLVFAAATLVVSAGNVAAQPLPARPGEIGVSVGGVASWFISAPGASVRFGAPLRSDWTLEGFLALADSGHLESDMRSAGIYGMQARRALARWSGARHEIFYSFGVLGFFARERGDEIRTTYRDGATTITHTADHSYVWPPAIGLIGIGAQRTLTPHLAVRGDVQAIALFVVPAGVRASAGISIPFGRYN